MKAVLSKAPGLPDTLVLEDVPSPTPKAGEVVVSVKAVGVNFPDFLIIQDMYQYKPARPFSPGGEISGVVKSVGEGVTSFKVGDKVDFHGLFMVPTYAALAAASALLLFFHPPKIALKDGVTAPPH